MAVEITDNHYEIIMAIRARGRDFGWSAELEAELVANVFAQNRIALEKRTAAEKREKDKTTLTEEHRAVALMDVIKQMRDNSLLCVNFVANFGICQARGL